MAAAVTYQFYKDVYGGGLSEAAFGLALPAAMRHVRWLVGGAEPSDDELEAYQRSVCAAVDAFAEFGEGQVGGFSIGDFKVTHYEDEGTTGEEIATADALKELVGTSLAFAGVR
ncbi:MAG: hypothetical protein LKH08_07120 [Atopobiaceae bacterium]|nr:hypothetical protein [Atopobiaceae bacterium]MCH4119638.1 hypothetical protein [Atopobiaceae bacterium]MCI1388709.1 hypothetical protein [Atopobiaceae bacterium]MCI1432671.1 hypothetical protein [Atopobiaceae bacterium]MCI1470992.1 hypothetical protein [Atopobiaceae bacterium]